MRRLRRSEAQVALDSLALPSSDGEARSLPRRTRQTAARRVEGWNWFEDRWVPSPRLLGDAALTFSVFAPYADRIVDARSRWAASPEAVVVWAMDGALFGVFATRSPAAAEGLRSRLEDAELGVPRFHLTALTEPSAVPAWFDFAGAWARVGGLALPSRYPQALASRTSPAGDDAGRRPTPGENAALVQLIARSQTGSAEGGPSVAPAMEERLVRRGWVSPRTFLNPWEVGARVEGFPPQLALLHGRIRREEAGRAVFTPPVIVGPIRPFLLARNETEVLVGTLSRAGPGRTPSRSSPGGSVLRLLGDYLEQIQVIREPVASIRAVVNHRYSAFTDLLASETSLRSSATQGVPDASPAADSVRRRPNAVPG
ncbi:MAG TPA: hypothetical protein VEY07_04700 [Thermoplasmata archaeon]|nr:hypothetical protein [Thermoplasmata archaeon]